jgi:exodeoxyribonuclease VII large subunit
MPRLVNPTEQPSAPQSISELTGRLRTFLEGSFASVWVEGEITGWKMASSGHVYFSLKDEGALLGAVIWRSTLERSGKVFRDGDMVEAKGRLSVYDKRGQYQLVVDSLKPVGEGALYQKFLQLKAKLEAQGFFSPERKRAIPTHPRCIGIVTSPTGAALQDMLQILRRRAPGLEILIWPTAVQGSGAAQQIAEGIRELGALHRCDTLIVGRGGGSIEDLWEFNSELLVKAVVDSLVPVISAVGHEIDFTLCDFAADLRAPTPSAAAELVSVDQGESLRKAQSLAVRLDQVVLGRLVYLQQRANSLMNSHGLRQPEYLVQRHVQGADDAMERLKRALDSAFRERETRLKRSLSGLKGHNPELILQKGYAFLRSKESGRLVSSVLELRTQELLETVLMDGVAQTRVESIGSGD